MPSSVSIAKSGLSYRIRRHCVERSFLFWLPRSTPSTSVQSILDFRPPQTICHAYSRLPAGFNGSGMRLPTKAQAVDIVRFGWCEMFSSRSYRRRTAFRSYQQSTSHRPHKLPCHRPHAVSSWSVSWVLLRAPRGRQKTPAAAR